MAKSKTLGSYSTLSAETSRGKLIRFAYVDFEKSFSLSAALGMNGKKFKGRELYVDLDYGAPKKSYRYDMERANETKYNRE